ncbi:MAG TPA: zf-HC2 domain-containing protein [Solirubrobacteraceae bacterium]|nr:zf-HC2 domain-containing protein [Solirubrobacteraceae bacterium]
MSGHTSSCDELRHELGAYVLGALTEDEEGRVREHLAGCSACRDEHARLAGLRPLLDLAEASPERPAIEQPSPLLEDAVIAGYAAERGGGGAGRRGVRRRLPSLRVALPSAAAGAALAVAVLALAGVLRDGDAGEPPTTAVELQGAAGSARAVLEAAEAGTVIELDARLPPSGRLEHYDVLMLSGDYEISAGTFRVGPDGRVIVTLACGGPPDVYDRIEIRSRKRTVLAASLPA